MKFTISLSLIIISLFVMSNYSYSQADLPEVKFKSLNEQIPNDPNVKTGTLSNGIKYYIKKNAKPENRAELYLVVRAGSIDEDDDQKGLAHFIEHMAFNGTKSFPKNDLINFLEKTGVRFGADINASTGYDRTMYTLQVPTNDPKLLETGVKILKEWANDISFDQEEIDKERGVIIEEWRVRTNANTRAYLEQIPTVAFGSKYAERFPIGDTTIIKKAPRSAFTRFYKDWYRPDLQSVIAVGDFDEAQIEQLIKSQFGQINAVKNPRKEVSFTLKDHKDMKVAISTDKEIQYPVIQVYFKQPKPEKGSFKAYRESMINNLATMLFSQRFAEITQKPDAPFLQAYATYADEFLGDKASFLLVAVPKVGQIDAAYQTALEELHRVIQHGFLDSELQRAKEDMMSSLISAYNDRDKSESAQFAQEYSRNFMSNEAYPGIAYELALYKRFLPEIQTIDLNAFVINNIATTANSVITLTAPTTDPDIPTEKELIATYKAVAGSKLAAYVDESSEEPLMPVEPVPGKITKKTTDPLTGIVTYTLSNGARVLVKNTDFKNDEIIFRAYSPGGYSVAGDDNFYSARNAGSIVNEAGLGEFNNVQLSKKLAGKVVRVTPYISDLTEGLSGSTTPQDLETFFQLVNLYFTNPRKDDEAFQSYLQQMIESLNNKQRDPRSVLRDTLGAVMANYHMRGMPMTTEMLKELELEKAYQYYVSRFGDASDFNFIFVGNVDEQTFDPFVEKYIASLPKLDRKESWVDRGIRAPEGNLRKNIYKGIDPQSMVYVVTTGDFQYDMRNRHLLSSLTEVLKIRIREVLREDQGGIYSPGVWSSFDKYPESEYMIGVAFGCDPERVDELIGYVKDIFNELKKEPISADNLQKVKEIQKNEYEIQLKENRYWLNAIYSYDFNQEDVKQILNDYPNYVNNITVADIQKAAQQYLDLNNVKEFVLYPEAKETGKK